MTQMEDGQYGRRPEWKPTRIDGDSNLKKSETSRLDQQKEISSLAELKTFDV